MFLGIKITKPTISGGTAWINSNPLNLSKLKDKVVLLDFWTYSCVNCLRTLPYLKRWYEKYEKGGLLVIGVHSPEFEFEKRVENVKSAVESLGIKYPVVLDSKYKIWKSFENRVWPRKFIFDAKGHLRYDHSGEGKYQETEKVIQQLLEERFTSNPPAGGEMRERITLSASRPSQRGPAEQDFTLREMNLNSPSGEHLEPEHSHKFGSVCYPQTPETYLGFRRGICGNPGGLKKNKSYGYASSAVGEVGKFYLSGSWRSKGEYIEHMFTSNPPAGGEMRERKMLSASRSSQRGPAEQDFTLRESKLYSDYLALQVKGVEANLVCSSEKPSDIEVKLNGEYPGKKLAGDDLKFAPSGEAFVQISTPRMYKILKTEKYFEGLLQIFSNSPNLKLFAFTFGGCLLP